MKKCVLLLLATLMLASALTGCAAAQPYTRGYSNVSTTRNGYVNGTNGYVDGYDGVYSGGMYGSYDGAVTGYARRGTGTGTTNSAASGAAQR